jgi:hypothetical protein
VLTRTEAATIWPRLRAFGARHRRLITIIGSVLAALGLAALLAGRRDQFSTALSSASIWVLLAAALLQLIALLARSEAWHVCIAAAGGTLKRRILYRASSMGYVGSLLNAQVGTAARITALRRSAPRESPSVSTLIAAELPILAVEAVLAALFSFTLVAPLGLAWWVPIICVVAMVALSAGLRHLALRKGRELWSGLAVLRHQRGGGLLVGFVLVAVLSQIVRNWMLLHAVGVDASLFDAIALLIAVLILGSEGVAAVAAAGVLSTATGIVGGLSFAGWAGADRLWSRSGAEAGLRRRLGRASPQPGSATP